MNPLLKQPQDLSRREPISICLSIAVLVVSVLYSTHTIDPVLLPRFLVWSIFVLGFLLVITIQAAAYRNDLVDLSISHRSIFPAFICYLLVSSLSLIKVGNLSEGLFEWLKLFLFLSFLYSAALVFSKNRDRIFILARGIVLTAVIISALGICQYYRLSFTSIPGNYLIYATMAHKNLFASALFLMLPFVLYDLLDGSGLWRTMSRASLSLILVCIFLTQARAVWLAIIIAAVLSIVALAIRNRRTNPWGFHRELNFRKFFGYLSLTLAIISMTVWFYNHNDLRLNLSSRINKLSIFQMYPFNGSIFKAGSLRERFFLWEKSLEMVKDNPILGVGLGQWRLVFPAYGKIHKFRQSNDGLSEIIFQRPHNDYIWVLSESGIIGLLSYLAILGISIFYALKIIFRSEDAECRTLAILMLFGIIGYMVIAFFSFPKERIMHNIFFMLILASTVSTYHRSFPKLKDGRFSSMLVINIFVMFLLSFCVMIGYLRLNSEMHVKESLKARKAGDWQKVINEIDKSDTFFYQIDPVGIPLAWYRGIANYSTGRLQEAHLDFKKAFCIHPNQIHVLNNLGTSYAMLGDYKSAAEYYKQALDIWPGFQEARINLAIIYYNMGNFTEAKHSLSLLDRKIPDARVPIYHNLIENRSGETF